MTTSLTVGELARALNITPKTVRLYEEHGILNTAERSDGGYRLFTSTHVTQLKQALALRSLGLSLTEIRLVMQAGDNVALLNQLLLRRQTEIAEELLRLQHQQTAIQAILNASAKLPPPESECTTTADADDSVSVAILRDSLQPLSPALADALVAFDGAALTVLDNLQWSPQYADYWQQTYHLLAERIAPVERQFVFWLDRYCALNAMAEDDLQAMAWLQSLEQSSFRLVMKNCFRLPQVEYFPNMERLRIEKLLVSALFQQGNGWQQRFLRLLAD